ncbi:F-box/kelch-repeat protein SKIP4 [Vigna radiata var. radiata]|uniref:F-box/kelch-repeat protein SKIP4 n=1 Tax=Vigna radiata var. radiata TaxID=3916 RepID=A0A1S3VA26_VIGRR|nr:F-box/kelch-repeat protein SKIP4 [Vigna radiata var. radiata]XP_014515110.1 F-box/kelch-repeat protein SKIP4 [Vigna radiata var. radiata]
MENVDFREESSNCVNEVENTNSVLIYGLPDDISLMCLARVPRKYHPVLKCVSKRWRDLICNEEWCTYRRKHKLDETWIYALCRDKLNETFCYVLDPTASVRNWKLVDGIPPHISKRKGMGFEALGNKLFLLGGCSWSIDCTDEVYSYDASSNCWVQATSMSTARCFFACEVLDEKLYAIGGLASNPTYSHSWDTFDPLTNCWRSQRDIAVFSDVEDSVVLGGKIYVRFSRYPVTPHLFAIVYEPSSGTWQYADADMVSGWTGPAVVVEDTLYVLDQTLGTRLMMWHKGRRQWIQVGKLSPLLTRPPCQLVAVGRSIFIVGKMLSTVVVDVGNLGNEGQVLMSSSIPGLLSDFTVISCKCLAI